MRPNDMPAEEFRRFGYELVDWVAGYLDNLGDLPVMPAIQPGELKTALPAAGPEAGEPMDKILEDFRRLIVPAINHWNHPRFMGYFSVSASGPGILGELLSAAINTNHMVWKSNPAATELEEVVLAWLRQWIGLPASFFGIIYDTASVSTLHAIAAAREMADPEIRTRGAGAGLTLYTSEQAHSSVEKGAICLGIGQDNVRKIPVDAQFRMKVDALRAAIAADAAAGKKPFCVSSTVGTTSVASIDPVEEIQQVCEQYDIWHHVDASYAGPAAIIPEFRHILRGAERAHSLVLNPHKWLFTPIDISVFYTRRPDILKRAFSLVPAYLQTAEDSQATNYMDYGVQLGRRFRALKLWFVMRYFGRQRIAEILANHIRMAQHLAEEIAADGRFEIVAPVLFSLVCFRYKGSDDDNQRLLDTVAASGVAFLSANVLNGRKVIRLALGNIGVTAQDVALVWRTIREKAGELESDPRPPGSDN
jgi:aromatic-L-amino-acid/L-tryptophan decarboxylase